MKMKAVFWEGSKTPVFRETEKPAPKEGEVLLKVLRTGVCGTDLSILKGLHPRAKAPLILGHELAARVEALGHGVAQDAVRGLEPGRLVTVEPLISCGVCVACRRGFPHVCSRLGLYGIDAPGALAEYMTVAAEKIVPAPEGMDIDTVVLAEPMAVAVHTIRMSGIRYGDSVCIIGGGPIGLLNAMVVSRTTDGPIVISEPSALRREIAKKLGFEAIDPTTVDLEEEVARVTGGDGVDVCFECAGSQPAVLAATKVLRPRGMLVQVSIPKEPRNFNLVDLTFKEITVQGVRVYEPYDFDYALRILSEESERCRHFLSKPYALEEAPEAMEAAFAGDKGLRVVFRIAE